MSTDNKKDLMDRLRPLLREGADAEAADVLDDLLPGVIGDARRPLEEDYMRLAELFDAVSMPRPETINIEDDRLNVSMHSPLFSLFAEAVERALVLSRASNYVEMIFRRKGADKYVVMSARYQDRPTPHECLMLAVKKLHKCRSLLRNTPVDAAYIEELEDALSDDDRSPDLLVVYRPLIERIVEMLNRNDLTDPERARIREDLTAVLVRS